MIGKKLYYYRKLRGLTQEQLAYGICSIPHLSKIENGHETPSTEILEHLSNRLGITLGDITSIGETDSVDVELLNWYNAICRRDKKEAFRLFTHLTKTIISIQDPVIQIKYKIFVLGYYLLQCEFDKADPMIKGLQNLRKKLSPELAYYYYVFVGLYCYLKEDYAEALNVYEQAEKIWNDHKINDPDIFYHLALTNMHLNRSFISIRYSELALELFNKNFDYVRSMQCQLLLGVNLTRISNFDQAEKHLIHCLQVSERLSNPELLGTSYRNLGYLYFKQSDDMKAIQYYKSSLELTTNEADLAVTYYYLARSYTRLKDYDPAQEWIERGIELTNRLDLKELHMHLQFLQYQIDHSYTTDLESILKEEIIPYFKKRKNWHYVAKYAEILADYYSSQYKYKHASQYYSLVNQSIKNIYS